MQTMTGRQSGVAKHAVYIQEGRKPKGANNYRSQITSTLSEIGVVTRFLQQMEIIKQACR